MRDGRAAGGVGSQGGDFNHAYADARRAEGPDFRHHPFHAWPPPPSPPPHLQLLRRPKPQHFQMRALAGGQQRGKVGFAFLARAKSIEQQQIVAKHGRALAGQPRTQVEVDLPLRALSTEQSPGEWNSLAKSRCRPAPHQIAGADVVASKKATQRGSRTLAETRLRNTTGSAGNQCEPQNRPSNSMKLRSRC